jgi:hypothetical protein
MTTEEQSKGSEIRDSPEVPATQSVWEGYSPEILHAVLEG